MIFSGQGLVKWKGNKIANFIDGYFETNDYRIANRLIMLGFKIVEQKEEIKVSEPTQKWVRHQKKAKK